MPSFKLTINKAGGITGIEPLDSVGGNDFLVDCPSPEEIVNGVAAISGEFRTREGEEAHMRFAVKLISVLSSIEGLFVSDDPVAKAEFALGFEAGLATEQLRRSKVVDKLPKA